MTTAGQPWGFHTVQESKVADEWAHRHGIELRSRRAAKLDDGEERWTVSATTERGALTLEIETDGSYEPTAFGQLFEVWRDEEPTADEFNAAVAVLGEQAVGELALLVGWPVDPTTPAPC